MDRITVERRSANMAAIKGSNTKPELEVRRLLRELGVGYRLHVKGLPSRPDIVMKGRRKIILVHGCFWHRHNECPFAYSPKSRKAFWEKKFAANVARDERDQNTLKTMGWDVMVLWECEVADAKLLHRRISSFLYGKPNARGRRPNSRQRAHQRKADPARRRSSAKGP
ncbi:MULTISPECIES: very short patch repair endonuclease [unclassified Bradyrhizobium]|uniref:very short patch repair endonuclease n=1 Tax=unclassified Bradyrhizobium TaxID=2631580 RepID=UPI0028E7BE92|nr:MULTISPECIES: very short patch repair endonuclease [unclassified Bradyrhizobium]